MSFTKEQHRLLCTTILLSAVVFLESTMIGIAFPSLQRLFAASFGQVQWVLTAFTVPLVALVIIAGRLADMYSVRTITIIGAWIFLVAVIIAPFGTTLWFLVFSQAVAGIGAGLMTPGALVILLRHMPHAVQGKAIGLWSGYSAGVAIAGPVLGGVLIDVFSWRALFVFLVPITMLTLRLLYTLPRTAHVQSRTAIDYGGAVLVALTLTLFTLIVTDIQQTGVIRLFSLVTGGLCVLSFTFLAMHIQTNMLGIVPHEFFKRKDLLVANLLTAVIYGVLQVFIFFLIIVYDEFRFTGATYTGLSMVPSVLMIAVLSGKMGEWTDRVGNAKPLRYGLLILAVASALCMLGAVTMPLWVLIGIQVLFGIGMAMIVPAITRVSIPDRGSIQGIASGINNAVSRGIYVITVVIAGSIVSVVYGQKLQTVFIKNMIDPTTPEAVAAQGRLANAARDLPGLSDQEFFMVSDQVARAFEQSLVWPFGVAAAILLMSIPLVSIWNKTHTKKIAVRLK